MGVTTGGDGIGCDPVIAALPHTGLVVRFPLTLGINPDGTINELTHTQPHVWVDQPRNEALADTIRKYRGIPYSCCENPQADAWIRKVCELADIPIASLQSSTGMAEE